MLLAVGRSFRALAVTAGIAWGVTGCRGSHDTSVTERLWVSAMPRSPKTAVRAFITTAAAKQRYAGILIQGSMYRGGYDVFDWKPESDQRVTIRYRQDGLSHALTVRECAPSRGFHACIDITGEPTFAGRYQSRNRWVLRRGKKAADSEEAARDLAAAWLEFEPLVLEALDDVSP